MILRDKCVLNDRRHLKISQNKEDKNEDRKAGLFRQLFSSILFSSIVELRLRMMQHLWRLTKYAKTSFKCS